MGGSTEVAGYLQGLQPPRSPTPLTSPPCDQVHYYDRYFDTTHDNFLNPPIIPSFKRNNTVAYINRNCGAINGRNDIVGQLMKHYNVSAYGCLGGGGHVDKAKVFGESKFCIGMENRYGRVGAAMTFSLLGLFVQPHYFPLSHNQQLCGLCERESVAGLRCRWVLVSVLTLEPVTCVHL